MMERIQVSEHFKPIKDYEGLYEVSDKGRVKSVERTCIRKNGWPLTTKEKFLKQGYSPDGYKLVGLSKNGKISTKKVHRLVALAFLDNSDKIEVNHKDGNPENNNVSNLEWVSRSENLFHSYRNLGRNNAMKGKKNKGTASLVGSKNKKSKPVDCFLLNGSYFKSFESMNIAKNELGIPSVSHISDIINGKRKQYKGYVFRI